MTHPQMHSSLLCNIIRRMQQQCLLIYHVFTCLIVFVMSYPNCTQKMTWPTPMINMTMYNFQQASQFIVPISFFFW